jgi:hypothetical protein
MKFFRRIDAKLAILCLLCGGCATVNTMKSAVASFNQQVQQGNVKGIGPSGIAQLNCISYETATASGGLKCVIIHVWPKQTNRETQYVLLQMPGEKVWRMVAADDLDKTPLTSIPEIK